MSDERWAMAHATVYYNASMLTRLAPPVPLRIHQGNRADELRLYRLSRATQKKHSQVASDAPTEVAPDASAWLRSVPWPGLLNNIHNALDLCLSNCVGGHRPDAR